MLANIGPLRIKPAQRIDDDVAHRFRTRLGIDQSGGIERRQRLWVCLVRDAAQLQIAAIGQIDFARTEARRCHRQWQEAPQCDTNPPSV